MSRYSNSPNPAHTLIPNSNPVLLIRPSDNNESEADAHEMAPSSSLPEDATSEIKDSSKPAVSDNTDLPQSDLQLSHTLSSSIASPGHDVQLQGANLPMKKPEEAHGQNSRAEETSEGAALSDSNVKKEPIEFKYVVDDDVKPPVDGSSSRGPTPTERGAVQPERLQSINPTSMLQTPTVLPTTEGRKQLASKPEKKKGTASIVKKPASKKRKIEPLSKDGTPFSQRSGTPNSSRASKASAPKNPLRASMTPAQSSPPRSMTGGDEDDMDDSGELFCICHGPDDHSWMIGCDGECEDWFHGRCVNMRQEDAELVDKYICPKCAEKGVGVTTWKPMCRLERCRKPARVAPPNPSKYCSDEHGEEFMRERVIRKSSKEDGPPAKKKKTCNKEGGFTHDGDESDDQAHLRGGLLRAGELKALATGVKNATEFKRLGDSVFALDVTTALSNNGTNMAQANLLALERGDIACTSEEKARLEEITVQREVTVNRMSSLVDKEAFLGLVKARASRVLAEFNKRLGEGKKKEAMKDMCGFDSRLRWSDEEFDIWRASSEGSSALESGTLDAPPRTEASVDANMVNGIGEDAEELGRGVCQKKRCERHKAWYKLQQQELASEKGETLRQLTKLDEEAKGIGERAMLKQLMAEPDDALAGL